MSLIDPMCPNWADYSSEKMCPTGPLDTNADSRDMGVMVPNNIKRIRQERRLTQTQLGDLIGTSINMMGKLERGHRTLDTEWLDKIAEALGVEPYKLIAPASIYPTVEQLTEMLVRAQRQLPAGLPYSEWPRAIAAILHKRLQLLADDRTNDATQDHPEE